MKHTLKIFGILLLSGGVFVAGCGEKADKKTDKKESGPKQGTEQAAAPEQAPIHEISFPEDRIVGKLKARPATSDDPTDWQELGDARGAVKLPPNHNVMLDLTNYNVSDINFLTALSGDDIQELVLEGCSVGDDNLASMDVLRLKGLNMNRNPLTDQGLDFISTFETLEKLSLGQTHITDAGLAAIGSLSRLKKLWLQETAITDAGMVHIAGIPSLEFLILYKTGITDAGLDPLKSLPSLKRLGLRGTQVTNAALDKLVEFPSLEEVDVAETAITKEAAEQAMSRQSRVKFLFETTP